MKLIVGLGNAGHRYQGTRHNVGFEVLRQLARRFATGRPRLAFEGETYHVDIGSVRCLLLCPHTFMNRSGQSVIQARDFYKLTNEDLLVICDDFNLPLGKLRIRVKGSSGGQKGLEDIIRRLGDDVPRMRIGIGSPPPGWEAADYVLARFTEEELPTIQQTIAKAVEASIVLTTEGIETAMNRYNT